MPICFVADGVDTVFAKLFDQQFTKNARSGDESFGFATQYVYGPRYVNATATRIDLTTIAA